MKKQKTNNLTGFLLLIIILFGVFVVVSKEKQPAKKVSLPKPAVVQPAVVQPIIQLPAQPKPEITKPEPVVIQPKPVAIQPKPLPVKPKIVPAPVEPTPKPPVVAVVPKPVIKPEPKPAPKPVAVKPVPKPKAEPVKPKPVEVKKKFSFSLPFFKPKPKPVPVPEKPITPPPPKPTPIPTEEKGKIAIVLDDWGYTLRNMPIVSTIKYPFTAAILPNLPYSRQAASKLHNMGFEIILHLPMQPQSENNLEKNTITTTMDEATIRNIVEHDLDNIVYAKGANNHMGSLATEDPRVMDIVFSELEKRRLFFLDSFSTAKTVCLEEADKSHIGFAKRDIFLDNEEDPEYIKGQIYKLKEIADTKGWAIGIGHDRKNTLEVLSKEMPELAKEGYKFITISELVD